MQLGTIEGKVDTSTFKFRATEEVKKFDFISVKSNDVWILAQVEEVKKHPDGETIANANIIGYRDKGLTKAPRRVIEPDSIVYRADQELISDTLGLEQDGLRIGNLETNEDIDIFVNKENFYKHFAVLAQTGAGKCVMPDTDVLMSDGCLKPIKQIFDETDQVLKKDEEEELRQLNSCSVKALDEDYKQTDADALYAYRKKAEKILVIKTESGREVEVTPEHPLMVAENSYGFQEAGKIEEGNHIAVPREIETFEDQSISISEQSLSESHEISEKRLERAKNYKRYKELEEKGLSLGEIELEIDQSRSTIENWKYRDNRPKEADGFLTSINSNGIRIPERFSSELSEFLSLLIAESAEQQSEGSYRIIFTNNDERLIQGFKQLSKKLFGIQASEMRENAVYIDSTPLKQFLEEIGYTPLSKSRGKHVPNCVHKASKENKRQFLQTLFDCEGCVEDHEVTISSASEQLINDIAYLLLEFGIVGRLRSKKKRATNSDHEGNVYYELSISGVDFMTKFAEKIGFGIERKHNKLENYIETKEGNTNTDIIPIDGEYLKNERKKVGLSQRDLSECVDSHPTLISLYERNERRPSRQKFKKISEKLDSKLYSKLADSGVLWDKIESIEEIEYNGYVYDLTVREHHNFIAGKGGIVCHNSYLTGVLIEEMLEKDLPVLIIDPHGEYSSLSLPNDDNPENARNYKIKEYSPNTDINQDALPLSFSSVNMEKNELLDVIPDSLTNSQMGVLYNSLKRLREKEGDYTLNDLMDAVSHEDSTAKWNLLNSMEQLEQSGLFTPDPVDLEELLTPGEATIVNLRAVEPNPAEMTAYSLAKRLFDLRKENRIPPFIMVIEEAHNFAPEKGFGKALSSDILRKIASEGRKFGLGIGVISQRPARIDKNVLSQCNTQFILRVTNPNDLKAISKSFEGITSEVESMIKSLPPGVSFVLGNEYPVMTDVRTRKSKHGGTTQTSETYVRKEKIKMFEPKKRIDELETEKGVKYEAAYYPLYRVKNEGKEFLIDAVNGDVKAEREEISDREEEVLEKISEGYNKSEIMDELGITLSRVTTSVKKLREKGYVDEDMGLEETLFDFGIEEERVEEEKLIDIEKSPEDLGLDEYELVYYIYYSREDEVFDPVLVQEI